MHPIPVPAVLNTLAQSADSGIPHRHDLLFQQELELCRAWGFELIITNKRVYLPSNDDLLVPTWIESETASIVWEKIRTYGFFRIGSTNDEALARGRRGAPDGTLVYAEEQSLGRGRKGRVWISPAGKGLYFSIVLKPTQLLKCWPLLTHVASIALVETLRDFSDKELSTCPLAIDLKWPNDVLLSGKKCAGILLETTITDDKTYAAVVGVGINVHQGSVSESLKSVAVCLDEMAGVAVPRRPLLVGFLHHFQIYYQWFEQGQHHKLLEQWKNNSSMWNGVPVWIKDGDTRQPALTCGLSDIGALLVCTPEGEEKTLLAADISVRRK